MLSQKQTNLLKLCALVIVFMLPLMLAHYTYYYGGLTGALSNKGQLISPPLSISELNLQIQNNIFDNTDNWQDKRWHILYVIPEHCNKKCTSILFRLQQVHIALGKNTNRIQRVNIHQDNYYEDYKNWKSIYQKFPHMTLVTTSNDTLTNSLLKNNHIYLADPLGNIILSYKIEGNNMRDFDSKILKDTKRLLNISNIG